MYLHLLIHVQMKVIDTDIKAFDAVVTFGSIYSSSLKGVSRIVSANIYLQISSTKVRHFCRNNHSFIVYGLAPQLARPKQV